MATETPDYSTLAPAQSSVPGLLEDIGLGTGVAGVLLGAIGGYYQARAQQDELKSQASAAEFQRTIAGINARAAENDAQAILRAGEDEAQRLTLQHGQDRGNLRANVAARGAVVGQGSAADVERSQRIAQLMERVALRSSVVRQANAARARATDFRNRGLLAGVSADNLRRSAGTISGGSAAVRGLLDGGSRLALQYNAARRS